MFPERRASWNDLRYDYYASGRLSLFNGLFFGASISLSYAIETSLKCLAYEFHKGDFSKFKLWNEHNVKVLFEELENQNAFQNLKVSKDFLQYVHYTFQRYPQSISRTKKEISIKHGGWVRSIGFIEYYDDIMVKLDKRIYELSCDKSSLIFLRAFSSDTIDRTCIIARNIGLELNREFYLSKLSNMEARRIANKYPNFLSFELDLSTLEFEDSGEQEVFEPEKFKLPNKGEQWSELD